MEPLLIVNFVFTLGLGAWMFSLARRVQLLSPSKAEASTPDPSQRTLTEWAEEE